MRIVVSWSGGKDAALARRQLARAPDHTVVGLLTELVCSGGEPTGHASGLPANSAGARTKGHRLRPELVERQAAMLGLPVEFVDLPATPSNETYTRVLRDAVTDLDVDAVAYADLHLRDVRDYRESLLDGTGLEGLWPLWGRDPTAVLQAFLAGGTATVCAASDALGPDVVGQDLRTLVAGLPDSVDPAGEGGEYHTVVTDGPDFDAPLELTVGEPFTGSGHADTLHYRDLRLV